jgi:hypothetical protein
MRHYFGKMETMTGCAFATESGNAWKNTGSARHTGCDITIVLHQVRIQYRSQRTPMMRGQNVSKAMCAYGRKHLKRAAAKSAMIAEARHANKGRNAAKDEGREKHASGFHS